MIYTITANPSLDYYMMLGALRPGEMNRASAAHLVPGGKGVNVSLMLHRIGLASRALGFVAGETGRLLCRQLKENGVRCEFTALEEGQTRINVKLCAGSETECNAAGPQVSAAALHALEERVTRLRRKDVLVIGGAAARGAPEDWYAQLLRAAHKTGARTVVDTAGEPLRSALRENPWLIKPNEEELAALTGCAVDTSEAVREAARAAQSLGARNVLASLGARGALLLTERGETWFGSSAPTEVRSTVGAGDSMVAGFLAGDARCGTPEDALRVGLAAGRATARSPWLATTQAFWDCIEGQREPVQMT